MTQPAPPRKPIRLWTKGLALLGGVLFALACSEAIVRGLGSTDADGNFHFRGRILGPPAPPISAIRAQLERYRNSSTSRMIYDPQTGWTPRPDSSSHGGMYRYNSAGIRSAPAEYPMSPRPGVLRIALFGDSFTHGDDVPYDQTWGAQLNAALNERGIPAEVLNFGVSAYGLDQAMLRWRTLGRAYRPHVVLVGFQAENVHRHVNLLRGFYVPQTGIPFSKPRFILDADGELRPVNLPTLPLDRVPHVMARLDEWEFGAHEYFAPRFSQRRAPWQRSRLFLLLADVGGREREIASQSSRRTIFSLDAEPARVTRELLRRFEHEVKADGAQFAILHLPTRNDLKLLLGRHALPYEELLKAISAEQRLIDPQGALVEAAVADSLDALFTRQHYSRKAGGILTSVLLDQLPPLGGPPVP